MALQGSLAAFGISEILQLVGVQQKTGILHVEGGQEGASARLFFLGGRLCGCTADGRGKHDLLGRRLLAAELITKDQLNKALKAQKRGEERLGALLVAAKAVDPESLDHFVLIQLRERLGSIFEWRHGHYRFESKARGLLPSGGPSLSAEAAMMDGVRMMDEWPLIRARINNYDVVFRTVKTIEDTENDAEALERILDDAFSEFVGDSGSGEVDESAIGRNDKRILEMVDGKRSVYALIDRSRMGEFETCKALLTLLNEGFIEPVKVKRARQRPGRRGTGWGRLVGRVLVNVAVLGGLVAGVLLLPAARGDLESNASAVLQEASYRLRSNRIAAVSNALDAYRLEHGAYPPVLAALVEAGLLDPRVLDDAAGLDYLSIGSDYDLR